MYCTNLTSLSNSFTTSRNSICGSSIQASNLVICTRWTPKSFKDLGTVLLKSYFRRLRDIHIAFPQTASPSIVGISSKLPVKNEIQNETYAPAMYATVKRNSVKPSASAERGEKNHRVSVIGIEAPDLKVGEKRQGPIKSFFQVKYRVTHQVVPNFLLTS